MDSHAAPDHFPLHASREPNPLRPYYIPPSIGPASTTTASPSQTPHVATRTAPSSYGAGARDYLPEIDLDVSGVSSDAWASTRKLVDALAWRYFSVLLAQPFEVGKTLCQIALPESSIVVAGQAQPRPRASKKGASHAGSRTGSSGRDYDDAYRSGDDIVEEQGYDSERSDGMPDYFTSSVPHSRSRSPRKRRRRTPSLSPSPPPASSRTSKDPSPRNSRTKRTREPTEPEYQLRMKRPDSVTHAMGEVYRTSGALGLWRASNATFLYSILMRTTDSFIRSILLALLGLPELDIPSPYGMASGMAGNALGGALDLSESPSPMTSLLVVGASSCLAGLLLAPLDIIRTRLIVTPSHYHPRGVIQALRRMPSLLAPSTIALPTALAHTIPTLFSSTVPLLLRWNLRLSPEMTPQLWSMATFLSSLSELFVRLPLETVLRRAQVATITAAEELQQQEHYDYHDDRHETTPLPTLVDPAPYRGVWATVYGIMYLEGETTTKDAKGMLRTRRGHGAAGLVRGWRIGFWGLVGVWGAGSLGGGGGSGRGEF